MAAWTLIAATTPAAGSVPLGQLAMASERKMTFSLLDHDTLSFSMPGRHPEAALIVPLVTDILAYRDYYCVQRFRVLSSTFSKSEGVLTANFTAVSYGGLLDAWIINDREYDPAFPNVPDQRRWPGTTIGAGTFTGSNNRATWATAPGPSVGQLVVFDGLAINFYVKTQESSTAFTLSTEYGGPEYDFIEGTFTGSTKGVHEQSDIAWKIITDTQTGKANSNLGITRGVEPVRNVYRILDGDWTSEVVNPYYYDVGKKKGEAIAELAAMSDGFEWDIEPDRTTATTATQGLKFNSWNVDGRYSSASWLSPFVLDDGGSIKGWTKTTTPADYANVIYAVGQYPTGIAAPGDPPPSVWLPASKNPDGSPAEGRWEQAVSVDSPSRAALELNAKKALADKLAYQPEWSIELAAGRWPGPETVWLGDYCRMIVDDGPVVVDSYARIVEIGIDLPGDGNENLTLGIDRPRRTYSDFRATLERRLQKLER